MTKKQSKEKSISLEGIVVNVVVVSSSIKGIAQVYLATDSGQMLELSVGQDRCLSVKPLNSAEYFEATQRLIHYAANSARKVYRDGLDGVSYGTRIENGR